MSPRKTPRKSAKTIAASAAGLETGVGGTYTLEVVAELTGLPSQTIVRYWEQGLISPVSTRGPGARRFDDEALRRLRRIEHLCQHYQMEIRGLELTLGLIDELERLRDELRSRR